MLRSADHGSGPEGGGQRSSQGLRVGSLCGCRSGRMPSYCKIDLRTLASNQRPERHTVPNSLGNPNYLRICCFFFLFFAFLCFSAFLGFSAFVLLCFSAALLFRFSCFSAFLLLCCCFFDCLLRFSFSFKFLFATLPCFSIFLLLFF